MDVDPDSNRAAATKIGREATHEMPRWVRTFGVAVAIAVVALFALHLAGGGMGHFAHGGTHILTAEHDRHLP